MAEAVILGSGTSNGVPMLGVEYSEGFLSNPKNHRTRSSCLLRGPEGNVIIDCSPEMRLQLLRERVMMVDAAIITHTHADHIMGMDDLRSFCIGGKKDLPVFTLPQYQEDIRRIFNYAFQKSPSGIEVPRFDLRDVEPLLEVCGLEIETMTVWHGRWPVVGIRCGGFGYLTDVNEIPDEAWQRLRGLETLVLDAVRYAPHPNHFHFEKAVEVARALDARKTYFTHLSHDYDHDVVNASLPEGMELAYDGLPIPIAS